MLVIDAAQGIEAQTLANTYLALEQNLEIVPVINKIDLPAADPERVKQEIEDVIGLDARTSLISAKANINIGSVLEKIISDIPAPSGDEDAPLKAMIFDSAYDSYKGVVVYMRIVDGKISVGDRVRLMATGAEFDVVEVGYMKAVGLAPTNTLYAGEVGYFTASIKTISDTRVGDTVTLAGGGSKPGPSGLSEGKSHGILRHLPRGRGEIPRPAGRAGEIKPQ